MALYQLELGLTEDLRPCQASSDSEACRVKTVDGVAESPSVVVELVDLLAVLLGHWRWVDVLEDADSEVEG